MTKDRCRVFVYGSLKSGFYNHKLLQDIGAEFIDNFATAPEYKMWSLGYFPCITEDGDTPIFGEIYEVDSEFGLSKLDRLEGHPRWYKRKLIDTHVGPTWVYVFHDRLPPSANRCDSGVWEER